MLIDLTMFKEQQTQTALPGRSEPLSRHLMTASIEMMDLLSSEAHGVKYLLISGSSEIWLPGNLSCSAADENHMLRFTKVT